MTEYYVGVYGTSNKTQVKIETIDGEVLGEGEAECSNIHLSVKHAWDAILRAIKFASEEIALDFLSRKNTLHMGLGLKYTELAEACIDFIKAKPANCESLELKSDGYVLCLGCHTGNGATIIVDEGVVGNAVINKNELFRLGGWGFPHADKGSYPWIGIEAIRLTLQWIDGYIDSSPMLEAIFSYFESDTNALVQWAMHSRTQPSEFQVICDIVFKFLANDDIYAVKLLQQSANEVEKVYYQLVNKTGVQNLPCALSGYVVPFVMKFLDQAMLKNIIPTNGNGLDGAIKMIRLKNENY